MKTTYKFLAVLLFNLTVLSITFSLKGQNVFLLGTYEFDGTTPDAITSNPYNLNFSNIVTNTNTGVVFLYEDGYLKTSGWKTTWGITNNNIYFSIQRNGNQNFKVSHVKIFYNNVGVATRALRLAVNEINIATRDNIGTSIQNRTLGEVHLSTTTPTITAHADTINHVLNDNAQSFKIGTRQADSFDIDKIEIYGYANFNLYEDFNSTSIVSIAKITGTIITDFNPIDLQWLRFQGWTGSTGNQYAFAVTNDRTSSIVLWSTATDSAYIKTPSLDLSSPYEIKFETRSRVGAATNNGIMNIYDNNSGLLWTGTNTATTFTTITTSGYISSATENITFAVPKTEGSEQVIENIVIQPSTQPALSYGILSNKALGTAKLSTSKAFTIPLKAANLTGDVTLTLKDSTNFILPDGGTITQSTAETGTDLNITFIAPETLGTYTDTLTISAAGTTDRVVVLSATSDLGTATTNLTDGSVVVTGNQLTINGHAGKKASIYNLSGATLFLQERISDRQVFTLPSKGVYLLKLEGSDSFPATAKVMIR